MNKTVARKLAFLAFVTFLWIGWTAGAAAGEPYRLGPGDRLQITVFGSESLSGVYDVQASGAVALPLAGHVKAAGLTIPEFEAALAKAFVGRLPSQPSVTVAVATYRSVYVMGNVRRPGAYPFVPDMTVQHAIAIAGGMGADTDTQRRTEIEAMRTQGTLAVLSDRRLGLEITKARLLAERDGKKAIAFPKAALERQSEARIAELIANERRLFETRAKAMASELRMFDEQVRLFQKEIDSLEAQLKAEKHQAELVRSQLKDIQGLVGKGLAPRSRLIDLQRELSGIETRRLELDVFLARARQKIVQTKLQKFNRIKDRELSTDALLRDMERQLAALDVQIATERGVLAKIRAPLSEAALRITADSRPVIRITRNGAAGRQVIEAADSTAVMPGDIIEILGRSVRSAPASASEQ